MNLRQKLLTLDIAVLLLIAIFFLVINEWGNKEFLFKFFIPIMLTAYFIGRYIPLQIVKKHIEKEKKQN